MITIEQLKKELNLKRKDLAELFDMSDLSFANSTAKKRYENALCMFLERIKKDFDLIPKQLER